MSGYAGDADLSLHQAIQGENGVEAIRQSMVGAVLTHCLDCEEPIPEARRQLAIRDGMKCEYCVSCLEEIQRLEKLAGHVAGRPKMLTKML